LNRLLLLLHVFPHQALRKSYQGHQPAAMNLKPVLPA
jgi:hypothetical protein